MGEEILEGVFGADLRKREVSGRPKMSYMEVMQFMMDLKCESDNICYIYMIHDNYMMYDMMMNKLYFSTLPFSSTNPYSLIGYHLCWG